MTFEMLMNKLGCESEDRLRELGEELALRLDEEGLTSAHTVVSLLVVKAFPEAMELVAEEAMVQGLAEEVR